MSTGVNTPKVKAPANKSKGRFSHTQGVALSTLRAGIEELKTAVFDPELIEDARAIQKASLLELTLKVSPLASYITSMSEVIYTDKGGINTKAVMIDGSGFVSLAINPKFSTDIAPKTTAANGRVSFDVTGDAFVLTHEAYHVILGHLRLLRGVDGIRNDLEDTAFEAFINYTVIRHAKSSGAPLRLPTIDGEVVGIDPRKVWEKYRDDLKEQNLTPLDYEVMFTDDLRVYSELTRMKKPPKFRSQYAVCVHMGAGTGDQDGDGQGGVKLDPEAGAKVAEKALEIALHEAISNGNSHAKSELLNIMELTPELSTWWGDQGFGALRGQTSQTHKTDAWERWTNDAIASRLDDGERMVYNRKIPWDPRVAFRGDEEVKQGVVAIDASGSMQSSVLEKIAALIGRTDKMEITWVSFDGAVWPFVPGEGFKGGGGTSLGPIDEYLGTLDEEPDFCLVLTDGYVPTISPKNLHASQWIFLITPGGSEEEIRKNPEFTSIRTVELP